MPASLWAYLTGCTYTAIAPSKNADATMVQGFAALNGLSVSRARRLDDCGAYWITVTINSAGAHLEISIVRRYAWVSDASPAMCLSASQIYDDVVEWTVSESENHRLKRKKATCSEMRQ